MRSAARAANDLAACIDVVKAGTLRVYGDWFGRPYDNFHRPLRASSDGDDLVVTFSGDEVLTVSSPDGWEFTGEVFRVDQARRVVWRWYYYGRPKLTENLRTIEHWVDATGEMRARSDAGLGRLAPSLSSPAAELL